jgi:hypothetical protein
MHKVILQGARKYDSSHFVTYQRRKLVLGWQKLRVQK